MKRPVVYFMGGNAQVVLLEEYETLRIHADRMATALEHLLGEVEASGNSEAIDFGWPDATKKSNEALEAHAEFMGRSK